MAGLAGPTLLFSFVQVEYSLMYMLAFGLAFSAARSFREEKAIGLFELLLIFPAGTRQLFFGRLNALRRQVMPSLSVLIPIYFIGTDYFLNLTDPLRGGIPYVNKTVTFSFVLFTTLLTVTLVGMLYALTRVNLFVGWILTVFTALVGPWLLLNGIAHLGNNSPLYRLMEGTNPLIPMIFIQWLVALAAGTLLYDWITSKRIAVA